MTPEQLAKMTGAEQLRNAVAMLNRCRESVLDPYTAEQLLAIWRACMLSEYDFYPDEWTERQLREALEGKVPKWRESSRAITGYVPVYDT